MSNVPSDIVDLTESNDEDEDLRRAIALSLQDATHAHQSISDSIADGQPE